MRFIPKVTSFCAMRHYDTQFRKQQRHDNTTRYNVLVPTSNDFNKLDFQQQKTKYIS